MLNTSDVPPGDTTRAKAIPIIIVLSTLLLAFVWLAFRVGLFGKPHPLPILGSLPAFSLTASNGRPFTQGDLQGRVWIANFIYTTCPSVCPMLSGQMLKVERALERAGRTDVRLVSFSVDPKNDTPETLTSYGQRFSADPQRWFFVTGEHAALHHLIIDGFHLAVAERSAEQNTDGEGLITHSDRFVLLDKDMQVRGYYRGSENDEVQQLLHDAVTLQPER
ncbi:MAG: SCO family protein [Deltaproteobacteria bacterium]|nr:SCO family protein [Deltaproteobacteria bacterium]